MLMVEKQPRKIDPAYSTSKAGEIMGGIDPSTVWRLCVEGKIGYFKVGNRYKVRQSDIDRYMDRYAVVPKEDKEIKDEQSK